MLLKIFIFENVIFTNFQFCGFWCQGYRVFEWYLVKGEPNYHKLLEKQKVEVVNKEFSVLPTKNNKYIELGFLMNSGDVITIICETIIF